MCSHFLKNEMKASVLVNEIMLKRCNLSRIDEFQMIGQA